MKTTKIYPRSTITELVPSSGRKSFYRKAYVIDAGGRKYLKSYGTVMASVDADGKTSRHSDHRSATTDRHVLSFIDQFSSDVKTSAEFRALPVVKREPVAVEI